jgi:hypothetical protein
MKSREARHKKCTAGGRPGKGSGTMVGTSYVSGILVYGDDVTHAHASGTVRSGSPTVGTSEEIHYSEASALSPLSVLSHQSSEEDVVTERWFSRTDCSLTDSDWSLDR